MSLKTYDRFYLSWTACFKVTVKTNVRMIFKKFILNYYFN